MYKLLTTAAVIMTVATPSIANDWTGGKELTNKLNSIYSNLDGGTEFKALQGTTTGNDGQLTNFFSEVNKGVTHVTLTVDPVTNNISTDVVGGTTFGEIQTAQSELVERVNFDLFVQDSSNADTSIQTFDKSATYAKASGIQIDGDSSNTAANDYSNVTTQGLAGRKIDALVGQVNLANDYLIAPGRTNEESAAFTTAFDAGTGTFNGADISVINGHITGLNNAINDASDVVLDLTDPDNPVYVSGSVFGNIGLGGLAEDNVNQFVIPAFNDWNSIGAPTVTQGYTSISDWASGIETVQAGTDQYRYEGAGVATSDGTTISIDGNPVTDLANTAGLTKVN